MTAQRARAFALPRRLRLMELRGEHWGPSRDFAGCQLQERVAADLHRLRLQLDGSLGRYAVGWLIARHTVRRVSSWGKRTQHPLLILARLGLANSHHESLTVRIRAQTAN